MQPPLLLGSDKQHRSACATQGVPTLPDQSAVDVNVHRDGGWLSSSGQAVEARRGGARSAVFPRQAVNALDGQQLSGRHVNVELAVPTCEYFGLPPKPKDVPKSMGVGFSPTQAF